MPFTKLDNFIRSIVAPGPLLKQGSGHESQAEFIQMISALCAGGRRVDKYRDKFTPQRLEESYPRYQERLEQSAYTPVMGAAINQVVSKFATGSYTISPSNDTIKAIDKSIQGHSFINETLRLAIKYQDVYCVVEPFTTDIPISNLTQQKEVIRQYNPTVSHYTKESVYLENFEQGWVKIVEKCQKEDILGEIYYDFRVRIITEENYYHFYFQLDKECAKWRRTEDDEWVGGLNSDGNFIGDKNIRLIPDVIPTPLGELPVFKFSLPAEKYVAEKLYQLQFAYSQIQNSCYDAARNAGVHQRWMTPIDTAGELDEDIKLANDTLITAEKFDITEIKGTCIASLRDLLSDIERQIKTIASLSGLSFTDEPTQASGISKRLENQMIEESLREFGFLITEFYQKILTYLGKVKGTKEEISVRGLDNFELDNLHNSIEVVEKLNKIKGIAPSAVKDYLFNVALLLNPNASAEEKENYRKETLAEVVAPSINKDQE